MKTNNSKPRTSVIKKALCVFLSILSAFTIILYQPNIVAKAEVSRYTDTAFKPILEIKEGQTAQLITNHPYFSLHSTYACIFQSDGNLNVYRYRPWLPSRGQFTKKDIVWSSCTPGYPNSKCYLQKDGNLVIYTANGRPIFSAGCSNPNRKGTTQLRLSNTGVLSIYNKRWISWDKLWRCTSSSSGYSYRTESIASLMVGKWVKSPLNGNQADNTSIIIDFEDNNGRMKMDFNCVKTASWPEDCKPIFLTGNFDAYSSFFIPSAKYKVQMRLPLEWSVDGETIISFYEVDGDDPNDYALYCNEDGTKIWISWGGNAFVRAE